MEQIRNIQKFYFENVTRKKALMRSRSASEDLDWILLAQVRNQ
jgi:hypothetical protein